VTIKTRNRLIIILIFVIPLAIYLGAAIYKGLIKK